MSIITAPLRAPRLDVTASHGVPFMVLFDPESGLVEFWDLRYPGTHFRTGDTMPGQFTGARYDVTTLLGENEYSRSDHTGWSGVILDGGVPNWRIDGSAMHLVRQWLRFTRHRFQNITQEG